MADADRKTKKPEAHELGAGDYTVRAGCEITLSGVVHKAGSVVRLSDAGAGANWDCIDRAEPSAPKKKAAPAAPPATHGPHTK